LRSARSGHNKTRIGIFGGTLDPIHIGHLRAAEEVFESLRLREVWFMPAFQPPHKSGRALSSFAHRLRMAELATEDTPHFRASPLEAERPGPSYSVDTTKILKKALADTGLCFIVGSDAFLEFETWKSYNEIPLLAELTVILRPPAGFQDILDKIGDCFPDYSSIEGSGNLFVSGS